MRIIVSLLAYDGGKSGIADYMNQVVKELRKEHQLTLLIQKQDVNKLPATLQDIPRIIIPAWLQFPLLNMCFHLFILPFLLPWKRWDACFLPAGNRRLFCRYPIPTAVTFHDLSQFHIEQKYDRFRMYYIKKIVPRYLRKAKLCFAISESTKQDMVQFYHMPAERILVNYNGYQPAKLQSKLDIAAVQSALELPEKYILYISRLEHPGKNHIRLMQAYENLPKELQEDYALVCAGSPWSGSEAIKAYHEHSPVKGRIFFPGFVPDEFLGPLYRGASLYMFPSFYEGFGIPLLEAMDSRVPVACSNRSSLPEIGGDAVLVFNPDSVEDMSQAMEKILTDTAFAQSLREKGITRCQAFSWEKHTAFLTSHLTAQLSQKN